MEHKKSNLDKIVDSFDTDVSYDKSIIMNKLKELGLAGDGPIGWIKGQINFYRVYRQEEMAAMFMREKGTQFYKLEIREESRKENYRS